MRFAARNAFYLRVSKTIVISIYVYLDERHMQWMSDAILQHVLSDLRPHLLSKLKTETDMLGGTSRKSTMSIHRGETYQFCYFLRKAEPHSLVVKSRNFRAAKPQLQKSSKGKRKELHDPSPTTNKKPRLLDKPQNAEGDEDENERHPTVVLSNDMAVNEMGYEMPEEDPPKLVLSMTYQGFRIYGGGANPSGATNAGVEANPDVRMNEPLFLPEEPESNTPPPHSAGQHVNRIYLNQVLEDTEIDDENGGGMMEFSQVLQTIGDSWAGAMNDDEDMDESILFGDADENKEL